MGATEEPDALPMLATGMGATRAGITREPPPRVCASTARQPRNIATTAKASCTFLVITFTYLTRCSKHPGGCSIFEPPDGNGRRWEKDLSRRCDRILRSQNGRVKPCGFAGFLVLASVGREPTHSVGGLSMRSSYPCGRFAASDSEGYLARSVEVSSQPSSRRRSIPEYAFRCWRDRRCKCSRGRLISPC